MFVELTPIDGPTLYIRGYLIESLQPVTIGSETFTQVIIQGNIQLFTESPQNIINQLWDIENESKPKDTAGKGVGFIG